MKWFINLPIETCNICKAKHPGYVVHNLLWQRFAKTGVGNKTYDSLCLDCLGKRMGREVTINDLKPGAPCNTLLIVWWMQNDKRRLQRLYGGDEREEEAS